jgi:hypothetical protein
MHAEDPEMLNVPAGHWVSDVAPQAATKEPGSAEAHGVFPVLL